MTTTYANGDAQAPLSEQVTHTRRKVTKAAPRASSIAGTIARSAVVPGPGLPIRPAKRAIRPEQPRVLPDLSKATSSTISGVGVGIAPIAPSVIVEEHRVVQSQVSASSALDDTVNPNSIILNDAKYPGWIVALVVFTASVALWSAIYFIVTAALSLGGGQ